MQVIWHQSKNFGDDLNRWLWIAALGSKVETLNVNGYGIGTILDDTRAPRLDWAPENTAVLGSGAGYGPVVKIAPIVRAARCVFVRGPMTAELLGLAPSAAITDAGVLLGTLPWPEREIKHSVALMPHCKQHGPWLAQAAAQLGWHYIDPYGPTPSVIDGIRSAKLLVTEAMHGAIAADAMGTPWVPYQSTPTHTFKWLDWAASMDFTLRMNYIPPGSVLTLAALENRIPHLSDRTVLSDRIRRVTEFLGKLGE